MQSRMITERLNDRRPKNPNEHSMVIYMQLKFDTSTLMCMQGMAHFGCPTASETLIFDAPLSISSD